MIHTLHMANDVINLLHISGFTDAKLIGSFGKGNIESNHDIDVLLNEQKTEELENKLKNLFRPTHIEYTDWGGIYYHNTQFGNIDIFFSTKKFDY